MENLLEFKNFHNEGNIDLADIFTLNENGSGVKYSKDEFKKFFEGPLNESEYMDESLVNSSYAFYELSMLYESKSSWLETEGKFMYLDCDSHVMLIKNGEGHMIEKSTFDISQSSLDEGLWDDIQNKWISLTNKAASQIKNIAKKTWDTISYGAKKAWEFAKTCANAVIEFAKGLSFMDWVGITLSVLAAVISICGTIAEGSVVFSWVGPILQEISAIMMMINGSLSIYEGSTKVKTTTDFLGKHHDITDTAKVAATVVEAAPDYVMGFGMICLGVHNLAEAGAAAALDPTAGTRALVGNTTVKSALISTGKNLAQKGSAIEKFVEEIAEYAFKSEISKKIGSTLIEMTLSMFGSMLISEIMGTVWVNILKAVDMALGGISAILSIPKKINSAIESFAKSANNTFTKILAKGLNALVKPMTSSAEKVISKYLQPKVDSSRKWLKKQILSYQKTVEYLDKIKGSEDGVIILSAVKKAPNPKDFKTPKNKLAPKQKIDADKVSKKDLNIIRKAQKKSNIGESYTYSTYTMNHIKPFNI
jgi:hypothetical protein